MAFIGSLGHNSRMRVLLTTCLLLAALASTNNVVADETSIDDFAFLTGFWRGTGFGGESEEIWMPPAHGRMFGIFTQYSEGELVFSEYMEITQENGEFLLRLKHFNPDFSGWEEKTDYVTFKFESVEDNKAVFSGLSYQVSDNDTLTIALRMRRSDGNLTTEQFSFSRIEI